jgi:fatty acid CoA ligase FadD9
MAHLPHCPDNEYRLATSHPTRHRGDWLIDAGYPIQRIANYGAWLQRFETTLRALPEKQRQASLLPLHNYQRPEKPTRGTIASTDRFRPAVQEAKNGPDKDIPHVSAPIIVKYITNL